MKFIKDFYITIILSLIIVFLSLSNVQSLGLDRFWFFKNEDKVIHFLMYFGLSFSLITEYYIKIFKINLNLFLINLFPVFFGGFIEILQSVLTNNRSGDWLDFFADATGVIFALMVFFLLRKNKLVLKYIKMRRS